MKTTIALLLLFPLLTSAQVDSNKYRLTQAGIEFERFHKQHTVSVVVSVLGVGIGLTSLTPSKNAKSNSNTAAYIGVAIALVGVIINLNSFQHIHRAAIIMSGNGIAMPINGKRKKPVRSQAGQ